MVLFHNPKEEIHFRREQKQKKWRCFDATKWTRTKGFLWWNQNKMKPRALRNLQCKTSRIPFLGGGGRRWRMKMTYNDSPLTVYQEYDFSIYDYDMHTLAHRNLDSSKLHARALML